MSYGHFGTMNNKTKDKKFLFWTVHPVGTGPDSRVSGRNCKNVGTMQANYGILANIGEDRYSSRLKKYCPFRVLAKVLILDNGDNRNNRDVEKKLTFFKLFSILQHLFEPTSVMFQIRAFKSTLCTLPLITELQIDDSSERGY